MGLLSQIIPHGAHYGAAPGTAAPSTVPPPLSRDSQQECQAGPRLPWCHILPASLTIKGRVCGVQRGSKGCPDPAGPPSTALGQGEGAPLHRDKEILGFIWEKRAILAQLKGAEESSCSGQLEGGFEQGLGLSEKGNLSSSTTPDPHRIFPPPWIRASILNPKPSTLKQSSSGNARLEVACVPRQFCESGWERKPLLFGSRVWVFFLLFPFQ